MKAAAREKKYELKKIRESVEDDQSGAKKKSEEPWESEEVVELNEMWRNAR